MSDDIDKDKMIANMLIEIERLKSWEYFKNTLEVMQSFTSLSDVDKNAIMLMIDGLKYRKQMSEVEE